jgi:threonine synthase
MAAFRRDGGFTLDEVRVAELRSRWVGARIDDDETLRIIEATWDHHGILIDPHTAVALGAAQAQPPSDLPMVVLSTAHPAKFPDAVHTATGIRPSLPERLRDLFDRPERLVTLPADLAAVRGHIEVRLPPEADQP